MTDAEFEAWMTCCDPEDEETGTDAPRARAHFVAFEVPGQPVAKGRPIIGMGFHGRPTARTPAKTATYENLVKLAAAKAMAGREPFAGAVLVYVDAFVTIPQSWSGRRKAAAERNEIAATKKPDLDNIVKAVLDGMNGIAYADDSQIVAHTATKAYSAAACVKVRVVQIDKERA